MITRIAQISATHLSPSKPFFRSNFDLVAEHLREVAPDLVINTGDLALDGADSDDDLLEAVGAHRSPRTPADHVTRLSSNRRLPDTQHP
jgi:3',5'-cyclic-AMP phosphodiesterase